MLPRHLTPRVREAAAQYPVVTLTGPRQSGKTTLVRAAFPEHAYASLETPDQREFALEDPRGFLSQFDSGVILDEVQRTPELFSYLQGTDVLAFLAGTSGMSRCIGVRWRPKLHATTRASHFMAALGLGRLTVAIGIVRACVFFWLHRGLVCVTARVLRKSGLSMRVWVECEALLRKRRGFSL